MNHRREIIICLGSSCFSRGNKELLKSIQRYINKHGLDEKVRFKGEHCFERCSEGPNMMIGGRLYHQVSEDNILDMMEEGLHDLIKEKKT